MSGDYILDSNIVIDIFRNDTATINAVATLGKIYIPVIVLGELYYGAHRSSQLTKKTIEIDQLKRSVNLLEINEHTAAYYGQIKNDLRKKGKPIPENDIWIAAIAMETGLTVLTNDEHFRQIDGIQVVSV